MISLTFIGAVARRRVAGGGDPGGGDPPPEGALLLDTLDELADPAAILAEDGEPLELG